METPKHYESKITPVEYIVANNLDFLAGNVLKYLHRHKYKNKDEDIKKLIHYACYILKYEYNYSDEDIANTFSKYGIQQTK